MPLSPSLCDNEQASFTTDSNGNVARRVTGEVTLSTTTGTPFFSETQTTTTGALQTLISEVVPGATTRQLLKVVVVCRQPGKFEIKINSTVVGSGRTGAANMNVEFSFNPGRNAAASDTIAVEFTQAAGPTGQDVEAYLMATDII